LGTARESTVNSVGESKKTATNSKQNPGLLTTFAKLFQSLFSTEGFGNRNTPKKEETTIETTTTKQQKESDPARSSCIKNDFFFLFF
jgi:hypothetical protein